MPSRWAFSVPNLASALPALFPTEHRYTAMGIAYNLAVAIFGGTAPFIIVLHRADRRRHDDCVLPHGRGRDCRRGPLLPSRIGRPHLPGSMPSVESEEAARKLVETQDSNPLLDVDSMPFEQLRDRAGGAQGPAGNPTVM
ncbi:hypothetical protein GCM10009712_11410 [Pseudarthrobacter sulfonivorans]|uniref:hypothetical protein n=1 Tax=Pseudarthrobacter sulfonivorans TaxID=121292 RepID=UPI00337D47F9